MSKAEEIAKQLYPDWESTSNPKLDGQEQSNVRIQRQAFLKGYHQAVKDLTLTWKDVALLININEDINNEEAMTQVRSNKEHYEEVLKRFNDMFFH